MSRHVVSALCMLLPCQLHAQSASQILGAAEQRYAAIRTLTADFRQVIDNPVFGDPEETNGVLYLSPPERFAMRFIDPAGDRIVADGEWLWLWNPSTIDDQVIRSPIPTAGPATPNLFAQFVERPLERYEIAYVGKQETAGRDVHLVELVPRSEDIPFAEATVYIDAQDWMMRAIAIVEHSGQRRYLEFDNVIENRGIPEEELSFTPPPGVRVVTPRG